MICLTLRDLKIVVVEDHDDTRSFLARFLTRQGATVFTSPDAESGLETVQRQHPDVIISDICLPDRDGFEFLRDIRALGQENGGSVPVIAMTAFGTRANRGKTIAAGFQKHLEKPFGPDDLLDALQGALE